MEPEENKQKTKEKKKSKLIRLLIIFGVIVILFIIFYNLGFKRNKTRITELSAMDGVSDVKEIWHVPFSFISEKYVVTYQQPLDWNNPSAGKFPQRVIVNVRKNSKVSVLETDGYGLMDNMIPGMLSFEGAPESAKLYNGNYIHVEHRFCGKSRPDDMTNDDVKYWTYFTSENTAADYHHIYTTLKSVLGDKWLSIGTSRGGLETNVYSYYYPDDMLVYLAYVAPCSDGLDDERFYDNVYNTIGNEAYGEDQAKEYRDMVLAFQVEAMRYKNDLKPRYEKKVNMAATKYVDYATPERLYDMNVLEFAVQFWQSGKDFKMIKKVLDMPDGSDKERKKKADAVYKLLLKVQDPRDWSTNYLPWPFYVNATTEYGQYHYNFSYLREALDKEGLSDRLSVTEDMEAEFMQNMVFTPEEKSAFKYDGTLHDNIVASMDTTTAKHLMIYGSTDPWYGVAMPVKESDNIKIFVHPTKPHSSCIKNMPKDKKKEIISILDEWLGEQAK